MANARIIRIEQALGVRLPQDYARFVIKRGVCQVGDIEVYAWDERIQNEDAIPCVIGATRRLRQEGTLQPGDIVIAHTGYEDFVLALDTQDGGVYELGRLGRRRIAESFELWLRSVET